METLSVMAPRNKVRKYDAVLKYEKKLTEDLVKQRLFARAGEITDALVTRALEGDVAAIKESYDRMFGKATTQLELNHDSNPIIFMPAVLVNKFNLSSPQEATTKATIIHDN